MNYVVNISPFAHHLGQLQALDARHLLVVCFVLFCVFFQHENDQSFLLIFHRCMLNGWGGMLVCIRKVGHAWVCVCMCVCMCVCVCFVILFWVCLGFFLHVKALLRALVYMILWFYYNVMDLVNVVMFYLVIISDATHPFLPGGNRDLLNWLGIFFFAQLSFWDYGAWCSKWLAGISKFVMFRTVTVYHAAVNNWTREFCRCLG